MIYMAQRACERKFGSNHPLHPACPIGGLPLLPIPSSHTRQRAANEPRTALITVVIDRGFRCFRTPRTGSGVDRGDELSLAPCCGRAWAGNGGKTFPISTNRYSLVRHFAATWKEPRGKEGGGGGPDREDRGARALEGVGPVRATNPFFFASLFMLF